MKNVAIYLNANASGSNILFWENKLSEILFYYNTTFRKTKNIKELSKNIKLDIKNNVDLVVAVGGNGTVNSIVQEIVGKKIKLFIVPTGTTNDLATQMGITQNLKYLLRTLEWGQEKQIDLIKVNERYITANGAIGLASDIANSINHIQNKYKSFRIIMKLFKGKIHSLFFAIKLITGNIKRYKLLIESSNLPYLNKVIHTPLVLINNQSTIINNLIIAPKTLNNDGTFNVTIFTHSSNFALAKVIMKIVLNKDISDDSHIISFETNNLIINSADGSNLNFFGDGEPFTENSIINITMKPRSLDVCYQMKPERNYSIFNII